MTFFKVNQRWKKFLLLQIAVESMILSTHAVASLNLKSITNVCLLLSYVSPRDIGAPQWYSEIWEHPLLLSQWQSKHWYKLLIYLWLWIDWHFSFSLVFLFKGIVKRDEIVFRAARRRGIPILMVTSGGYQKKTARIIADSILNLHQQGLIVAEALEGEGSSSLVTSMMCSSGSVGSKFTTVWDELIELIYRLTSGSGTVHFLTNNDW